MSETKGVYAFDTSRRRNSELGAEYDGCGVNFAIFSEHASKIELCLFDPGGDSETARLALPHDEGGIWSGYIPGLKPGQLYGYRVHGPYAPEAGHRFNPNKLLLDPYAKEINGEIKWDDALHGYILRDDQDDLSFDPRDSAPFMPKCVVQDADFDWDSDLALDHDWAETIFYEGHVRGLTMLHPDVDDSIKGTFAGVCDPAILAHLQSLGVTALELLPIHAFTNDKYLVDKGLSNYWGYQTISFFAPQPRYLSTGHIAEVKQMVKACHKAGIEVILDVVYNHTGEGSELGPTLSFRGIDNASYYVPAEGNARHTHDDTGTGNTLNIKHPFVLRMVMDSLRFWVQAMHVDGFRFDLASTLGREADGFDREGGFFRALLQDPVLSKVKLIAEPWDIGDQGYQVGGFPWPFREWNDKFRDDTRAWWRGDPGMLPDLSQRLLGSPVQFDHSHRPATSSINFLSAHDGFTLRDTVSYAEKHNEANGEGGADGHSNNLSANLGAEGDTDDTAILDARARRMRAMMSTLMVSQGVPMILAGDEIANSQGGNNNAYCQDTGISWIDWAAADQTMLDHTRAAIALRRELAPAFARHDFRMGEDAGAGPIVVWHHPEGRKMEEGDWQDAGLRCMGLALFPKQILIVINSGGNCQFKLPAIDNGAWALRHDSSGQPATLQDGILLVPHQSLVVLTPA